ncbi:MAG: hypothetical protein NTY42_00245 [Planctomycetota bacterium]|nr:hypothetical protein [Planctomycetota bacterium]
MAIWLLWIVQDAANAARDTTHNQNIHTRTLPVASRPRLPQFVCRFVAIEPYHGDNHRLSLEV